MTAWFPIILILTMFVRLAYGFLELEYGSQTQTIMTENEMLSTTTIALIISICVDVVNAFICFIKKRK